MQLASEIPRVDLADWRTAYIKIIDFKCITSKSFKIYCLLAPNWNFWRNLLRVQTRIRDLGNRNARQILICLGQVKIPLSNNNNETLKDAT